MTTKLVSIVIPAYNEEDHIAECLESVIANDYSSREIVVVDDCSTDRTSEIASKYPVKVIRRQTRGGVALARNDGLREAHGEIVAFVDADCTVDKPWLTLLTSQYTNDKIAGVGGIISTKQTNLFAKYRNYLAREEYTGAQNPEPAEDLPGGNSSYRVDVLRVVGGFDPAFAEPRAHETYELGHRLRKKGYVLIGEPEAVVWHSREGSLRSWMSEAYSDGYAALAFLKHYRMGEFVEPQLRQIAFLGFLALCIAALLRLVPTAVVIYVTLLALAFEILRALYESSKAVRRFRNLKYLMVFPVELLLRALIYLGYIAALLSTILKAFRRIIRR
jgi:glycosyltransferase involved in cell wall biosynthesis